MEEKPMSSALYQPEWLRILKVGCIMVNLANMTKEQVEELALTEKELEELERARNMPITFDEDCPETPLGKAVKFRRVNPPRQQQKDFALFRKQDRL